MSYFPTTHWSLVLKAGHGSVETAKRSLEQLCRTYWYPLYSYSRSLGDGPEDAEDLIQGFFGELVENDLVARAESDKGRFRSFLLGSFKHHRSRQRERNSALKRGGGAVVISLDEMNAEERVVAELQDGLSPDVRFERNWAVSVLDETHRRLGTEYTAAGKRDLFDRLRIVLQSPGEGPGYATIASELGKSEAAVKMDVSRMRARYRELLRMVVGETVSDPGEVDGELQHLMSVLSS